MEVKIKEKRCDRCGKVLSSKILAPGGSKKKSDLYADLVGTDLMEYRDLCNMCRSKAKRLLKELRPVDLTKRGRRNGKPGKKEIERKEMIEE
jgi:hypothetical protein